jgi:hypothetical protein
MMSGAAQGAATGATFGPWGAAIGGVAGAIGGGKGGDDSGAQDAMRKQQEAAANYQNMMQGYGQQYLGPAMRMYGDLSKQALSGQPMDYGLIANQIKQRYARAGRDLTAGQYGTGAISGGVAQAQAQGLRLGSLSDLAQAYGMGLQRTREMQGNLAQFGTQAGMGFMTGAGRGAGMYQNAMQNQVGYEMQQGQQRRQDMASTISGLGAAAGGLADWYQSRPSTQPTTVTSYKPEPIRPIETPYSGSTNPYGGSNPLGWLAPTQITPLQSPYTSKYILRGGG